MVKIKKGSLFSSGCQTLVNAVNCVGVMGAGIALEFRLRYPKMFNKYKKYCDNKLMKPGTLWIYKVDNKKWILNFPSKNHWRYPSKIEYLEIGLEKFIKTYKQKGITSIAFPLLGSDKGGIEPDKSKEIMIKYLADCDILIEIFEYDVNKIDKDFKNFKNECALLGFEGLVNNFGLNQKQAKTFSKSILKSKITNLSSLCSEDGLGIKTVEKVVANSKSY